MQVQSWFLTSVCAVSLVGCGGGAPTEPAPESPMFALSETGDGYTNDLPASAPVIRAGITGSDAPFSITGLYGDIEGMEVDILRAIGEEEGFNVIFQQEDLDNMMQALESGTHDVVLSVYSDNAERRATYAVSDPYVTASDVIFWIDPDLRIQSVQDLPGHSVAVASGTWFVPMLEDLGDVRINQVKSTYMTLTNVVQGRSQAGIINESNLQYLLSGYPEVDNVQFVPLGDPDPVIMMARKTDDGAALIAKINSGIAKLKAKGEIEAIHNKWTQAQIADN